MTIRFAKPSQTRQFMSNYICNLPMRFGHSTQNTSKNRARENKKEEERETGDGRKGKHQWWLVEVAGGLPRPLPSKIGE